MKEVLRCFNWERRLTGKVQVYEIPVFRNLSELRCKCSVIADVCMYISNSLFFSSVACSGVTSCLLAKCPRFDCRLPLKGRERVSCKGCIVTKQIPAMVIFWVWSRFVCVLLWPFSLVNNYLMYVRNGYVRSESFISMIASAFWGAPPIASVFLNVVHSNFLQNRTSVLLVPRDSGV